VTYFQLAADEIDAIRDSGPGGTGHAGEFETSVMLHLHPEQVRPEHAVTCYPDPGSRYLSTDLTRGGRVRTYLDFRDLSGSGVFGDPGLASAEKGQRFLDACTKVLDDFVTDFAQWPVAAG
jgi:creatinine amidohydrolase